MLISVKINDNRNNTTVGIEIILGIVCNSVEYRICYVLYGQSLDREEELLNLRGICWSSSCSLVMRMSRIDNSSSEGSAIVTSTSSSDVIIFVIGELPCDSMVDNPGSSGAATSFSPYPNKLLIVPKMPLDGTFGGARYS